MEFKPRFLGPKKLYFRIYKSFVFVLVAYVIRVVCGSAVSVKQEVSDMGCTDLGEISLVR